MIQQAVILAAGRGARLDRPGTPKPLVEIGGKSIIVRLIEQLQAAAIDNIHAVLGYEHQKTARALAGHAAIGAELNLIVNRRWPDGIASSVLAARPHINGNFLLLMADHVFDDDLIQLMARKTPEIDEIWALIDPHVTDRIDTVSAVKVELQGAKVAKIGKDIDPFDGIDAGCFAATPALFEDIRQAAAEGVNELFDCLKLPAHRGSLRSVSTDGRLWYDVDTPRDVIEAEMGIRKAKRQSVVVRQCPLEVVPTEQVFSYQTGELQTTTMVVGRNWVADPAKIAIIPEESASSPIFVFTDERVNGLYGEKFVQKIRAMGYDVHALVLPEGEGSKSLSNYVYLVERVFSKGVDERSVFISLGGGVVCNVCGFIASTIYRGLKLIHLPTSLMAQCDAAISHKQAINSHQGKNMIGSYYSPDKVIVDVETLLTLTDRQLTDGMSEIIKHALGQSSEYCEFLLSHTGEVRDLDFLEYCIKRNVDLKCQLAADDPHELGQAMVLQYGHTIGHPIEHLTEYQLYHGESITIGMMVAARVSRLLGAADQRLVDAHERLIKKYQLPTTVPEGIAVKDMLQALKYNKRYLTEGTRMALLCNIGELWHVNGDYVIPVPDTVLSEAFEQTMEH